MSITTAVDNHAGQRMTISFDAPDSCPLCHNGVEPKFLAAIWCSEGRRVEAAYRCPKRSCQGMFIGVYRDLHGAAVQWSLHYVTPSVPVLPRYPESVIKLSPRFVEIMGQVAAAEARKLDQLVGMGMRKAIEFLMKDFAIQEHPDQKVNIEKGELAWVIGQYIQDGNINAVAKRAAWLGNDETHYLRRWADRDITDLQKLVQLTVNWIESHELTKEYRMEMPDPARK